MIAKRYLGDSVYAAEEQDGSVGLTAENGYEEPNIIFLEWEVMVQLTRFIDDMLKEQNKVMEGKR